MNKAWHQEKDWGSSKARLGYPKGVRGNVIKRCGLGKIQRVLHIRMRNSNLIQRRESRIRMIQPQKQETTNMPSLYTTGMVNRGQTKSWRSRKEFGVGRQKEGWASMRQYSKRHSNSWQGPKHGKRKSKKWCGKLPRVNTRQKLRGVRKTSSSLTSTNWVCDGSKGDKTRCEMKEAGREAESKSRDPETAQQEQCFPTFVPSETKPHSS